MFEIENKVRMIVADMLINMDDKLNKQIRELKSTQTEIHHVNMRVAEVNTKLDREAKIRDLVDNLKAKISNMVSIHSLLFNLLIDDVQEKGMAQSIEKAVEGNDQLTGQIREIGDRIKDVVKERENFTKQLDNID